MQVAIIESHTSPVVDEFVDKLAELSLVRYASEAVNEMDFDSLEELNESVKKAMEICQFSGISMKGNFLRVYKSYSEGITYDWRLSPLAYKLVCICGNTSNPNVASAIVHLIKNEHLNHF